VLRWATGRTGFTCLIGPIRRIGPIRPVRRTCIRVHQRSCGARQRAVSPRQPSDAVYRRHVPGLMPSISPVFFALSGCCWAGCCWGTHHFDAPSAAGGQAAGGHTTLIRLRLTACRRAGRGANACGRLSAAGFCVRALAFICVYAAPVQSAVSPRHPEKWPDSRVSLCETNVHRTCGPLSAGGLVLRWTTGRTGPTGGTGSIGPMRPIGPIRPVRRPCIRVHQRSCGTRQRAVSLRHVPAAACTWHPAGPREVATSNSTLRFQMTQKNLSCKFRTTNDNSLLTQVSLKCRA
jgi:hypothetical protein